MRIGFGATYTGNARVIQTVKDYAQEHKSLGVDDYFKPYARKDSKPTGVHIGNGYNHFGDLQINFSPVNEENGKKTYFTKGQIRNIVGQIELAGMNQPYGVSERSRSRYESSKRKHEESSSVALEEN